MKFCHQNTVLSKAKPFVAIFVHLFDHVYTNKVLNSSLISWACSKRVNKTSTEDSLPPQLYKCTLSKQCCSNWPKPIQPNKLIFTTTATPLREPYLLIKPSLGDIANSPLSKSKIVLVNIQVCSNY